MKSYELSRLLLLLFLVPWDSVAAHCILKKTETAECTDLEDARYMSTYHLHTLIGASSSKYFAPGNFENLTNLRHLDASGGKIETIHSGSFKELRSLQTLDLSKNHLHNLEAGAFHGLSHLHSLNLAHNSIQQLPSALLSLKKLKFLDISENPLNCNCASLKLRDLLLARGVKISKKAECAEPYSHKYASLLKPDTKQTCAFEEQDREMQGDQPLEDNAEGSGEIEEDQALEEAEKDLDEEEKEVDQTPANENNEETTEPAVSSEVNLSATSTEAVSETASIEITSSSTAAPKDDITFEDSDDSKKEVTTTEVSVDAEVKSEEPVTGVDDDLIIPVMVPKEDTVTEEPILSTKGSFQGVTDDLIVPGGVEGSGENDDDGSGSEGSGMIAQMPGIDFNEAGENEDAGEAQVSSTSTTTTTTESSSWFGGLGEIISSFNPWGSSDETTTATTTTTTTTTEKPSEDDLKEEQFIRVDKTPLEKLEKIVEKPEVPSIPEEGRSISKGSDGANDDSVNLLTNELDEQALDPAFSQESKKGMGSYVVLAALLAILAILIAFAAYKGDFCRKKRKRRDVERGTELKDMQRSLLDQNSTQPKIQVSNGTTLENVPLMNSSPPEEPKDNQRSYDINPPISNGSSKTNGPALDPNDPVKPPRKSMNQEIEAPLNGLNPPMEDIDAPISTSLHNGSNEMLNGDYCDRPPLSPDPQRVKITLQEIPDSVPKTPILITRLKGENLVKTP